MEEVVEHLRRLHSGRPPHQTLRMALGDGVTRARRRRRDRERGR